MSRTRLDVDELLRAVRGMTAFDRSSYLDEVCADDPERRAAVEARLRPDDPTSPLPAGDTSNAAETAGHVWRSSLEAKPSIGANVGRYRIVREIGQGGMGVVYLAQDEKFRRRVALKVLKRGMDTEDVLRRFELERQLLASLNHAGIARLYDAGETESGLPYFVMEYVDGVDLERYCDTNRLNIEERLELFGRVCAAVHHAHQNLVVHRDLKPSNILVTAEGQPKLLDFGIAKVVSAEFSAFTGDPTLPEMRVMTPQYASPEQVRGETISTATDVYALGVILYEIVSGHRPYRLATRVRSEIERVICEVEPERPSTAISRVEEDRLDLDDATTTVTLTPETVSRTRESRPERLRRRLSGDIDNIVLKAMRKAPRRRYSSAEQLAEDIRRHLAGQPVTARADTFGYRASKFVSRHRGAVAAAAFVVISLAAGVVAASWGLMEARTAQEAEREQRIEAETQRGRADRRFDQVRALARTFMFDFHDAVQELDGSVPVREMLVTASLQYLDALRQEAGDQPELMRELASAYDRVGDIRGGIRNPSLGDTTGALENYNAALGIREDLVAKAGNDEEVQRELSDSHMRIGDMHLHRGDATGALDEHRQALRIREAIAAEAPHDIEARRDVAVAMANLGAALVATGDAGAARTYYDRSMELRETLAAERPDDQRLQREVSVASLRIGGQLEETGDADGALAMYEAAVATRERLAALNPDSSRARRDLAIARYFVGRNLLWRGAPDEAAPHLEHYLEVVEQQVRDNPENARARRDLAGAYEVVGGLRAEQGDTAAAAASYEKMREILEPLIAADPANTQYQTLLAVGHERRAELLADAGEIRDAIATGREALELIEPVAKADGSDVQRQANYARVLRKLGAWLAADGQDREARRRLDAAWDKYQVLLKLDPTDVGVRAEAAATLQHLSALLAGQEEQGALAFAEQALELDDERDPGWLREIAKTMAEIGRRDRAIALAEEALAALGDADDDASRSLRASLEADLARYRADG